MDFNFSEKYESFSNTELLKIVREAHLYQPAAISAANEILAGREILDEEIAFVDQHFDKIKAAEERIPRLKQQYPILVPLLRLLTPGVPKTLQDWLNGIIILAGIKLLWQLYNEIMIIYSSIRFGFFPSSTNQVWMLGSIGYLFTTILLMYKKERWGWLLMFGECIYIIAGELTSNVIVYWEYTEHYSFSIITVLLFFIRAAIVLFLWKPEVTSVFNIADKTKKRTVVIMGIAGFLSVVMIMLYN